MALPATLVWEIRPTNGTTNAGGGFDPSVASPGTDYSKQDAVQVAYTDLVIDGAVSTNVTSVATAFTSAHVGNNLTITGGTGFTTGHYNIRSVTGVTATLDRSAGTVASTGGTGNLGGAISGYNVGTTKLQASLVSGNKVYVKNEAWNEAVTLSVAGAAGSPIIHEGYNTVRDDAPTGANRPTNDRASAAGDGITISAVSNELRHMRVTRAGDAGISLSGVVNAKLVNVRSYNNTGEAFEAGSVQTSTIINSEFDTSSIGGQQGLLGTGNYLHDNTGAGWSLGAVASSIIFCIFDTNGTNGVTSTAPASFLFLNNTIYNTTGASGDALIMTTPTHLTIIRNNIFANSGRYGVNATDSDSVNADNNCFYTNATANRNNFPVGANDKTDVDPGFTNAAAGDFSIGTNLKAFGSPGAFPAGLSTGYLDIGAVQRQEAGGSGGGIRIAGHGGLAA